jgi:uncharacterized protein with PIN domain
VKFLADGMLGKLARWLRILGHDVIYLVEFEDSELLKLAKKEESVLLTKDLELYKRTIGKEWMLTTLKEKRSRSSSQKSPNGMVCY